MSSNDNSYNDYEIPHSSTLYPWLSNSIEGGFIRDDTFFWGVLGKEAAAIQLKIDFLIKLLNRRCFLPPYSP